MATFNRVFIFSSFDGTDLDQEQIEKSKILTNSNTSSLHLLHNSLNLSAKHSKSSMEPIRLENSRITYKDLFESLLGIKVFERILGVSYMHKVNCQMYNPHLEDHIPNRRKVLNTNEHEIHECLFN